MKEKTVSEAINFRRSVRKYDPKKAIDTNLVKKCIEQARLAPSSSNLQLWEFYHIKSKEFLKEVAKVCYNQPAAKTAHELVIPVVRLDLWPERIKSNVEVNNDIFKISDSFIGSNPISVQNLSLEVLVAFLNKLKKKESLQIITNQRKFNLDFESFNPIIFYFLFIHIKQTCLNHQQYHVLKNL